MSNVEIIQRKKEKLPTNRSGNQELNIKVRARRMETI